MAADGLSAIEKRAAPRFDLGKSLTAGYLNDDPFCDLVAGAQAPLSSTGEDGAVLLFPGRAGGPLTLGGSPGTALREARRGGRT